MVATYGFSVVDEHRFHLEQHNVLVPRALLEPEQDLALPIPKNFEKGYQLLRFPFSNLVPSFHGLLSRKGLARNVGTTTQKIRDKIKLKDCMVMFIFPVSCVFFQHNRTYHVRDQSKNICQIKNKVIFIWADASVPFYSTAVTVKV
ncbi:hypothetical protein [Flagellimonas sp.]|uniref:hypothetical protein n=1 Tax=Flagellimonas sp. TaxID=2058762 RepID=UPI003BAD3917